MSNDIRVPDGFMHVRGDKFAIRFPSKNNGTANIFDIYFRSPTGWVELSFDGLNGRDSGLTTNDHLGDLLNVVFKAFELVEAHKSHTLVGS